MPSLKPGFEIEPTNPVPLTFRPSDSVVHKVSDGEDWHSVAGRYRLPVESLIYSNFKTNVPREINWYLREYINCDLPTPDRRNWKFSTSARLGKSPRAGVVFIPLNWTTIIAAAKKATRRFVRHWFQFCMLGPISTQVRGPMLTVLPSGLRCVMPKNFPTVDEFKHRLREGGAPDELAENWAETLFGGLEVFTSSLNDIHPSAFPSFIGDGPFPSGIPSTPWPLLMGSASDGMLQWPFLRIIIQSSGIEGPAAESAMREYAKWFEASFALFRSATAAHNVTAIMHGFDASEGMAVGPLGFLQGPGMVL